MTIRAASPGDLDALRALVADLGYGGLDRATFATGLGAVLGTAGMHVWVADENGQVVGMVALNVRPQLRLGAPLATVDELVVSASARGRGTGGALLDHALAFAVSQGAKRIELHTQRGRESYARGFYEKHGFVEIDSAVMRHEGGLRARVA